jgi:hypothetical protein
VNTLRNCASVDNGKPLYFDVQNLDDLKAALNEIAQKVVSVKLKA